MINSNTINHRQNEDQFLKIQYASRKCYNAAEIINYFSWAFCLLSALMIFVPDSATKFFTIGIPILLDIAALILVLYFNSKVENAANLRNFFDSQVLMINEDNYTDIDKQKLKELSLNIYHKHQSEADICIRNSGRNNPPGVRNWYEFKRNVEGVNAQFECQKQNVWWNKKMVHNRLILFSILFPALIIVFGLVVYLFKFDVWSIIACSAGIIIKIVERLLEHYKYHVISIKIETIQDHIENQLTTDGVNKLQALISNRRTIPVLEVNLIHRKKANKYSKSYEDTSCS